FIFFQAEDGIRDRNVTGVQTCALLIYSTVLLTIFTFRVTECEDSQEISTICTPNGLRCLVRDTFESIFTAKEVSRANRKKFQVISTSNGHSCLVRDKFESIFTAQEVSRADRKKLQVISTSNR